VFDAYSQGLPVVASRTDGLMQCVEERVTGLFFSTGAAQSLKGCFAGLIDHPALLADMSAACLRRARDVTHRRIHWRRWKLLVETFPALTSL